MQQAWPDAADRGEIMTLREIARYLKVSEKTIFRMVQSGDMPGVKVSSQWRFVRSVVDDWLSARMYASPKRGLLQVIGSAPQAIRLTRMITPDRVVSDIRPGTKRDILHKMVEAGVPFESRTARDTFLGELLLREEVVSTAIGNGVAFPHAREPGGFPISEPRVVLGICPQGADFGALDGMPTYVLAMPLANSEVEHLRVMAKLALVFRQKGVAQKVIAAAANATVMELLAELDG